MPAQYEAIRDRLIRQGTKKKKAQEQAARIYNAMRKRGQKPVTGRHK